MGDVGAFCAFDARRCSGPSDPVDGEPSLGPVPTSQVAPSPVPAFASLEAARRLLDDVFFELARPAPPTDRVVGVPPDCFRDAGSSLSELAASCGASLGMSAPSPRPNPRRRSATGQSFHALMFYPIVVVRTPLRVPWPSGLGRRGRAVPLATESTTFAAHWASLTPDLAPDPARGTVDLLKRPIPNRPPAPHERRTEGVGAGGPVSKTVRPGAPRLAPPAQRIGPDVSRETSGPSGRRAMTGRHMFAVLRLEDPGLPAPPPLRGRTRHRCSSDRR